MKFHIIIPARAFTLWVRTLAALTRVKIRCCSVMDFAGRTTTYCNPCLASAVYPRLNTAPTEDSRLKRYTDRYSIGLTGGIGVGKTTVTDHFSRLGVCIIDADEVSRTITAAGQPAVKKIAQTFGEQVLADDETLDRERLRELVFNNEDKKRQLEQILHPLIREQMRDLASNADSEYMVFSIPLLIETGQIDRFDRILVIDAPDQRRIQWIQKRSNLSELQIRKIINSQVSGEKRLALADDVINNDKDLEYLYQQVESLHQQYLQLSNCKNI